jgi:hypothetical protein
MDARPSAEQRQLEDAAERLATKLGPGSVGDLDDEDRRERLDAALVQAGWRELRRGTPDEAVASGVETAIVTRALARGACDTAFIGPVLAHDLLRRAGADTDSAGRTMALGSGLDVAIDAAKATSAVVLVAVEGGHAVAEVALGPPVRGVDVTRPVAAVTGAPVAIAGSGPLGSDDVTAWTALAVTLTAADLVGTMEGALVLATEYAKQRHQYGAAIGSYQAVQHLLAEAAALADGALSATTHAAWAVDALAPADARAAAAVAKAYASRAARTVCETAIQVHGGIGNTWDCMAHVFLRRALFATELFGGDGPQLALLARERWGASYGLR